MTGDEQGPGPSGPAELRPEDLALLEVLASGRPAAAAGEQLSMPLQVVVDRLQHIRAHYGVRSTAAALTQAVARGHLHHTLFRDHQDHDGDQVRHGDRDG